MAVVIGVVLAVSAGFAADSKYSGFSGESYKNAHPGPEGGVKERWLMPGRSTISTILPVGLGINLIRKGTTGTWSGGGATSAEFMAPDSASDDVIAVAADEQTAAFSDRFSGLGAAKEAFKFWAGRIR